ncbi:hypothetical protein K3495_g16755, partial [Podosphaera aphanis]
QKLNARAAIGYLIGYDGANKFRIWNPARNIIVVTRDVIFDEKKRYGPSDSLTDPLLIRDDTVLEQIDYHNLQDPASRYPNESRYKELLDWDSLYNLPIAKSLPIIPQHTEIQDDYSPPEFSKAIAYEQESIKISDTSMTPISLNSSSTEQPQIPISEEAQAEDITLSHNGGIEESAEIILGQEQGMDQQNLLRHVPQRISSRAGDVSADLTEENILPESTKRPRKAPRRDIYSSAGNYDIF